MCRGHTAPSNGQAAGGLEWGADHRNLEDVLAHSDGVCQSVPSTTADVIVRRGTSASHASIAQMLKGTAGDSFNFDGYLSASGGSTQDIRLMGIGGKVELEILVPKGSRVLSIDAARQSGTGGELEILLNRGSRLTLAHPPTQGKDGKWILQLLLG